MANTRERVKDFPSIVGTIQSDDYIPVDGATQGARKAQVKDIMDAPITGLDTIANTTKGAINELATTAGKVWVGTQAEYDALPDSKLTDKVLHCITDGEPSAYDSIWDKVGTDPLDTTASDCSGAINEINSSLSNLIKKTKITDSTDASGNIGLGSTSTRLILEVYPDRTVNPDVLSCFLTTTATGTIYMAKCVNNNLQPVASTNVAVWIVYKDI